ncbi:1-acyl-sn-glycerol-3-phosphate acyltransferase [Dokdonia sp.]|uniref:1-acyl-sn-glycerol-3-phosphate acyltransferase n=1 Tax=Dokdonia sp. TaxID=2024995 RepID=UPI003267EAD4
MEQLFYKIYQKITAKKVVSLGILFLFLLTLIFTASRIKFEEDITKLIPTNEKTSDIGKVLKTVNFADKIIVNIKRESNGSTDDITDYATQLIDSLHKNSGEYFTKIQGKIEEDDIQATIDFVYNNMSLFLDDDDYETITNRIQKDSIDAIVASNYKTLISPSGFIARETILKDPLGLSFLGITKLQELNFGNDFTIHNGFLLSEDKNHILLFITPTLGSSETSKNAKFVEDLYKINEQLNSKFQSKASSEYFGGVLIAVENARQIKDDIQLTVSIAMSILLIILILFYKKVSIPIILFIPTVFGGLFAVALLYLIRGEISAISLGIGSILLGITLDYSLHILTHIRSNNDIKTLYKDITKPILMSSLTTSLAFLCLLFLSSRALQDLGIFASISVLSASVFALLFIPLAYKNVTKVKQRNTFIDRLASYQFHKKKWIGIFLIIAFGISLFTYNTVTFNKDISKLNYEPQHLKASQERLDGLINTASKSVYLAAYSSSIEEVAILNDAIYSKLQKLKADGLVIDFSSIGAVIQSKETQNKKIKKWNSFWNTKTSNATKGNLIESGSKLGFKPSSFNAFYSLMDKDFKSLQIEDYQVLSNIPTEDYISSKNGFNTITSLVKVKEENLQELISVFNDNKQVLVIDRQQMNEAFLGDLKNDFNKLILFSLGVVLLILILFYKSFSLTLVTSIPIILTWLLTIGVMGLLHLEFNIFSIIISTFIFGLGIDYSIFITNGLLHQYRTGERILPTYKASIILSMITTILGIGVLIFAKHPALYSIALVSIIGILSAVIISFTIQPILFKLFIGAKTKKPVSFRLLISSILSFAYFGFGGIFLSLFSISLLKIIPINKKIKMKWFHKVISKFMKSVLYSNPFVKKKVINLNNETFRNPAVIISNHTSFLDILAIGMLDPKIVFLVNDWVYNSPVFGKIAQIAGFYPVSSGIENGVSHLQTKVNQGYSLMVFPEGTRALTSKIKRFHKGAFFLAEQLNLDILPILIHGNSEVNPKGSFLIRNGKVTVKILKRISLKEKTFGEVYKERTKSISAHFKQEYYALSQEIEHPSYFYNDVLEEYQHKGNAVYARVKKDLKRYNTTYKEVLKAIGPNDNITHISDDDGQLDILLTLSGIDRKIVSYIENDMTRAILQNSYLANKYKAVKTEASIDDALKNKATVLIINSSKIHQNQLSHIVSDTDTTLIILLKKSIELYSETMNNSGFSIYYKSEDTIILKR